MALNIMMRWEGVRRLPPEHVLDGRVHRPDQCTCSRAVQQGASVAMTQTWRSGEAFDRYLSEVLRPAMTQAGASGAPQVVAFEISDLFLPRAAVGLPSQRAAAETPQPAEASTR